MNLIPVPARSASARRYRHLAGWAAAAALLVAAPLAAGAPSTPAVTVSPGSPTNQTTVTFSWTAATPDDQYGISHYMGALDGAAPTSIGNVLSITVSGLGQGTHTYRVYAVQTLNGTAPDPPPALEGGVGEASITVDLTAPTISVVLSPARPNGTNGWYRNATSEGGTRLTVDWTCGDTGGAGIGSCPADEAIGTQGVAQTRTGRARDAAGNESAALTSPAFSYDGLNPNPGPMRTPTPGAVVAPEPTFTWGRAPGAETSGFDRYEVLVRIAGTYRVIARVAHDARTERYSSARNPALWNTPLPANTDLRWYVRTYDKAGNSGGSASASRAFRIDPTVPGPPTFTGGPAGPTNVPGPTFTWTGGGPTYSWEVSAGGTETILVSGNGPQTQAVVPPLPDGDYTLAVSQVTAVGTRGAEATREFQVDTAAPPAPVVTARPTFPTVSPTPSFSWTTEDGAYSRWRVIGAGGGTLQSSDTPLASTAVGPFSSGAFNFRVTQVDAAGNESAAALEPFSIVLAGATVKSRPTAALPRRNAGRMKPKAGALVLTRRPLLRWRGGPKSAQIFNLQVFKVLKRRGPSVTPSVRKIFSAFPDARAFRMPASKMTPGTCYVWRVWPFVNDRSTRAPLGVSNFCIASAKALKKAGAARRAARR